MSDICVNHISKSFDGRRVLEDFSYCFQEGSVTCIMGISGRGKTTLLNLLCGLLKPDTGTITGIPDKISFVFQEDRLCERFSAVRNIQLVTGSSMNEETIRSHLIELGLEDSCDLPVSNLSGGMKRRAAIARAICYGGDLLLLDEPFKGLDEKLHEDIIRYIRKYTQGKTVLCVTHDPKDVELLAAQCLDLSEIDCSQ